MKRRIKRIFNRFTDAIRDRLDLLKRVRELKVQNETLRLEKDRLSADKLTLLENNKQLYSGWMKERALRIQAESRFARIQQHALIPREVGRRN